MMMVFYNVWYNVDCIERYVMFIFVQIVLLYNVQL